MVIHQPSRAVTKLATLILEREHDDWVTPLRTTQTHERSKHQDCYECVLCKFFSSLLGFKWDAGKRFHNIEPLGHRIVPDGIQYYDTLICMVLLTWKNPGKTQKTNLDLNKSKLFLTKEL